MLEPEGRLAGEGKPGVEVNYARLQVLEGSLNLWLRRVSEAMGRSQFMPPWGAELTDEQTGDLVTYLRSINARTKEQ